MVRLQTWQAQRLKIFESSLSNRNLIGTSDSNRISNLRRSLDFTESQGKILSEKLPKTAYCKLHICIHTGI